MEEITKEMFQKAREALKKNNYEDFFEVFGISFLGTCKIGYVEKDSAIELEDYTKGGVDMIITIDLDDWKQNFKDYAEGFDVDEEICIMRQDPSSSYCRIFTVRQSVVDYEGWKQWITDIAGIIDGKMPKRHRVFAESIEAVNKWIYWCYNYSSPEVWIKAIWGDCGLRDHIMKKWEKCRCDSNLFYSNLDSVNREKLVRYVLENYNPAI